MRRIAVDSSTIASTGYERGTLEVEFKRGSVYRYSGVPRGTFNALIAASSKGRFLNQEIKPNYPFTRVG